MDIEPMECAVPTHTASPTSTSALPSPTDRFWFKLDAVFRGNEVRFINDYRDFSQLNLQEAFAAAENVHLGQVKENCEFMSVYFKGWQHSVVKVKKHITAGQELLVDYGVNYWLTYLPQMFTELHALEIANLKQQLHELSQASSSSSS
jgi:SET domain-containing protein